MKQKDLISSIFAFSDDHQLIPDGATIIIGLSGGPDSIFLLDFLASLKESKNLTLIAAHLNHQWRSNSADDVVFCHMQANRYQIPFVSACLSELGVTFEGSKEEIGRKARRFYLESLAKQYNADSIALAHHFDDQIETFFIRLLRGSSLSGLCAMQPHEGLYIRPLLTVKKEEIIEYLNEHGLSYLSDPSNYQLDYLRNRIRQLVVPALRQSDERFDINFQKTLTNLQNTEAFLETITQDTVSQIITNGALEIEKFLKLKSVLQQRILVQWLIKNKVPFIPSLGLLEEIIRFLEHRGAGQHTFYNKWLINKQKDKATIQLIN